MKGLILCGGSGTRLSPFTFALPKQLLPVANKPLLCYILDALEQAGLREIGMIVGERGGIIKNRLKEWVPPGLRLTYILQAEPLGLAHAVQTARPFLKGDDFMMILGDNLFDRALEEARHIFEQQKAEALIFLTPVADPRRYGIVEVKGSQIISLAEKPLDPRSNLAIMGIYLFKEAIFAAIERIAPSRRGELEITDAIQELIHLGGKVVPYMYPGRWMDIGRPEDLLAANREMLNLLTRPETKNRDAGVGNSPGGLVEGSLSLVAPSALIAGSRLQGPLVIGEGCRITGSVLGPYTALGDGSVLEDSYVENCVIFENVIIRSLKTPLRNSIIGQGAKICGGGQRSAKSFWLGAGSFLNL
ncbi:MAG: glucose-1-phosphate thymidylyltransferase [Dethiobacteria bacterium]|jgi:glucose-1-phosphate thymidylyltransferase